MNKSGADPNGHGRRTVPCIRRNFHNPDVDSFL